MMDMIIAVIIWLLGWVDPANGDIYRNMLPESCQMYEDGSGLCLWEEGGYAFPAYDDLYN